MSKPFFYNLLFIIVLAFYGCNIKSSKTKEPSSQPLTAISSPVATAPIQSTIDFSYKTVVLEADLPSPRKEMSGHIENLKIKVNYGSPSVKGREIWGELVPFNKVWRTGANEATTFTIDKNIMINKVPLNAGTYSLFTLPTTKGWQMIFNNITDQWGAYEYDETKDALRIPVTPQAVDTPSEMMKFIIDGNQIVLLWEKLKIPMVIDRL